MGRIGNNALLLGTDLSFGTVSQVFLGPSTDEFHADPSGASDSSGAFRQALNVAKTNALNASSGAAQGTAMVSVLPGTYRIDSPLLIPSNVGIVGAGMGISVIKAGAALPLTDSLFANETQPGTFNTRVDRKIMLANLSLDGSGRNYPAYLSDPVTGEPILNPAVNLTRNNAYSTLGYMLSLHNAIDCRLMGVEMVGHESLGIRDLGCSNTHISECVFRQNGKVDFISSPIWIGAQGIPRRIRAITNANPGVVTTDVAHGFVNGQIVHLIGVRGMNLPDGVYTVAGKTDDTFQLQGVNTTALGAFVFNHRTLVTTDDFTGSAGTQVRNNVFENNLRSGITFGPTFGGVLADNEFIENGESTIFSARCQDIEIKGNRIIGTNLTDIASAGMELQGCAGVKVHDNTITGTAGQGIGIAGCGDVWVTENLIRNPMRNAALLYPYGPQAERWDGVIVGGLGASIANTPVSDTFKAQITGANIVTESLDRLRIRDNTFVEDRNAPASTRGVYIFKLTTSDMVRHLSIEDNDFTACGIADQTKLIDRQATTVVPWMSRTRGNMAHPSEFPVVLEYVSVGTGVVAFSVGFTPSRVKIEAYQQSTTNVRRSISEVCRDRVNITSGTLGDGMLSASDGVPPAGVRVAQLSNDAVRITDAASADVNVAEFAGWTDVGFELNWTTHAAVARLVMTAYP